jgi:hypothetical protein
MGIMEFRTIMKISRVSKVSVHLVLACGAVFALGAASARAAVVSWDLNSTDANASLGSSSHTFTSGSYSIVAYGFDVVSGPDTSHGLYFKDSGGDHGLGLDGTPHNEIQTNDYIQFDFGSLISVGATNAQIKMSSVDSGESFFLYGSSTKGQLGTLLDSAAYGDSTNNTFINIPNFGTYRYISVISNVNDVLPWAITASITPVPEATSLVPTALLAVAVTAFEARRRRRVTA